MTNKSKSQKRREDVFGIEEKSTQKSAPALLKVFSFTDGKKIKAKNYADALKKRNKMMGAPPMSKSIDDNTK